MTQEFNHPIVFGTINNWKCTQMMRTYHWASIISSSGSSEDKTALTEVLFDDVNYSLSKEFKTVYSLIYPMVNQIAMLQEAHVVGNLPFDNEAQKSPDFSTFVYTALVPPGKHSIMIYDPTSDRFFEKILMVDIQDKPYFDREKLFVFSEEQRKEVTKKKSSSYNVLLQPRKTTMK